VGKVLTKGMIVLILGLVISAFTGIAAGQDSAGKVSIGTEGIITNTTHPEMIPGAYSALPALATAEFRIYDNIEINVDDDIIPSGTLSGRQWGILQIINTPDSSRTVLGNISETVEGDSFIQVEYPENATWNSTYIHWIFPPDFVLNEEIDWRTDYLFTVDYHTSALTPVFNPVTLIRYVNKSIFLSDGYQFNSYEVNFEDNMYESYSGRVAYSETKYTNSSILFDTFTTDLPLTYQTNKSYHDPITKQYISELNFGLNNSSIQLHRPYHFNFTAAIKLTDTAGLPVKSYPRIFFALDHWGPIQQGDVGMTAIMPSPLLPAHLTSATATTNVSNVWQYRHKDQVKLAFNQPAKIIGQEKIGIFRPSTHLFYLDTNGNGVWNGASVDKSYNFGITGDIPVIGDWNNDGKSEIGVFRNSTHMFYLDYNGNGMWNGAAVDRSYNFGITGDIPITGDWNNDGKTEIGVFRPSTHLFYLDYNGNGVWNGASVDRSYNFGITGDIPISGDWNADGRTEIGVFRPSTHLFYLDYNGNGVWNGASVDRQYNFGITGDIPISGDWNSDGRTEIGVFRPSTHLFYLDYNGNGVWNGAEVDRMYNFGITGDKPVTGKW
jgi:hypothetical protein